MAMAERQAAIGLIRGDIGLRGSSENLSKVSLAEPEIRQIFGHFLPPFHRQLVRGLVAKDFNFPAAYHAVANPLSFEEMSALIDSLTPDTKFVANPDVRVRKENEGAVVYTPYINGFYMNRIGSRVWRSLESGQSISDVAKQLELPEETVLNFAGRLMWLCFVGVQKQPSK